MQGKKVLIIDDDPHIRQMLQHSLTKGGAQVYSAENGLQGLRELYAQKPDLVILDIVMPEMDGYETCRQIRQLTDVPVIMLTSLSSEGEMIRGLDSGADDFVTKPFQFEVLLARARAVMRRVAQPCLDEKNSNYMDEYLIVDQEARKVFVQGDLVKLTPTEHKLLSYLVSNMGRVLSFRQILENVWGWEYQDSVDYVHVYISQLRRKLERDSKKPEYIQTEHGVGYRFEKPA